MRDRSSIQPHMLTFVFACSMRSNTYSSSAEGALERDAAKRLTFLGGSYVRCGVASNAWCLTVVHVRNMWTRAQFRWPVVGRGEGEAAPAPIE